MKKFLTLILMSSVVVGLSIKTANASETKATAKIPYDQCDGMENYYQYQAFPNLKMFNQYYPNIYQKGGNVKPPFYGKRSINFACGGTALSGTVTITKKQNVKIETCGDLAVQTEKEACSSDDLGQYKPIMKLGDGTKYIFKNGKIFIFYKNGTIDVENIGKEEF